MSPIKNTSASSKSERTTGLLKAKRPILLDGAIGTELQRRGAPVDPVMWSAPATLSHPDVLKAVHCDYINAGCDVITANTFFSSKNNVLHAGRGSDFVALNANAVRIARKASDDSESRPLVAGAVSTMPPLDRVSYVDKGSQTTRFFSEQIQIIEDEGADLLLLEMLLECESAACLLEACAQSRLPVWAGLSASISETSKELIGFRVPGAYEKLNEEPFEALCAKVNEFQPDAIGVMHTKPELLEDALESIRRVHSEPAFAYPNVGYFRNPDWVFPNDDEVDALCDDLIELAKHYELRTLGGCCGTTPNFIKRLGVAMHEQDWRS